MSRRSTQMNTDNNPRQFHFCLVSASIRVHLRIKILLRALCVSVVNSSVYEAGSSSTTIFRLEYTQMSAAISSDLRTISAADRFE